MIPAISKTGSGAFAYITTAAWQTPDGERITFRAYVDSRLATPDCESYAELESYLQTI